MASAPAATSQERLLRYNNGAVFLHWLTALILAVQVVVGFVFAAMDEGPDQTRLFTIHKTIGAAILILALIRLGWRLRHPPPPYPPELPPWERLAGVWTHRLFYVLLIVLPLSGLMAVSGDTGGAKTTPLIGDIPFPIIPGVSKGAGEQAGSVHAVLVWVTLALLVLHVAAALRHQFERNRVAGRMPPFQAPAEKPVPSS